MKSIHKLSVRIFIVIFAVLLVPFTGMLWYVKVDMESMLRDEINLKVVQNLSKSENEISQLFGRMANISNVFFRDPRIIQVFKNDDTSYYDRYLAFNQVISDISMQNLYDYIIDDVKITYFDQNNQTYASWSLNYGDYSYLLKQEWVQEGLDARGFVVWSMASRGYEIGKGEPLVNQIALSRSIMDDYSTNKRLGALLVSIDQQKIGKILETYKYSDRDSVFASSYDGELLFTTNSNLPKEELNRLAVENRFQDKGNSVVVVNGNKYLLSFYTISRMSLFSQVDLKTFYLTDYQYLDQQISSLVLKINILCAFFVVVGVLIAGVIAETIARPMRQLSRHMTNYQVGEMPDMNESERTVEIREIYQAFYNMSEYINELFARLKQEQAIKEKYHYESLRSKMSPHFLFNTLTSIRWMAIIRKADNIRESIDALASILEYSMTSNEEMVELARELEVVKSYCYIQNVRFGNSNDLHNEVQPELECYRIIKFILQPVVENCFKHAFAVDAKNGVITICSRIVDQRLILSVSDNGKGFSEQSIRDFCARRSGSPQENQRVGIGLNMIDERIRISFGEEYGIMLSNNEAGGALVEYHLPAIGPEEETR